MAPHLVDPTGWMPRPRLILDCSLLAGRDRPHCSAEQYPHIWDCSPPFCPPQPYMCTKCHCSPIVLGIVRDPAAELSLQAHGHVAPVRRKGEGVGRTPTPSPFRLHLGLEPPSDGPGPTRPALGLRSLLEAAPLRDFQYLWPVDRSALDVDPDDRPAGNGRDDLVVLLPH